jgi:hypothetical protein
MEASRSGELVEVYRSDSFVGADRIVRVVLAPEGVEAEVIDRNDREFPGAGQPGGYFVAVKADQREQAQALIAEAKENGLLTED